MKSHMVLGKYIIPGRETFIRLVRNRIRNIEQMSPDAWPANDLDPLIGTYDRMLEAIKELSETREQP